jgi:2-dehydro-3-deoxyphosphogluconate aldolase/(4S)-4-hydroxy-2-oxoglutarate aldolase
MNSEEALRKIGQVGLIPVIRADNSDEAQKAVEAVCEGGVPVVEITMTVPNAISAIRTLVLRYGKDVLVGAGTVLNARQAVECLDAGAEFLVSPGLSVPVLEIAKASGKLAIPGVLTPSELMAASEAGVRAFKVFPCGNLGGPKYIKTLHAPFPHAALIPTGGVNLSTVTDYIAAGAFALGVGSELVDLAALRRGDIAHVANLARDFVRVLTNARAQVS